jgi:hypothetical protein
MNPTTVPTEATIIPGGLKTAAPYEYRGPIYERRDETLRWFDEQEKEHAARCCSDNEDKS